MEECYANLTDGISPISNIGGGRTKSVAVAWPRHASSFIERTSEGKAKATVTRCVEDNVHDQSYDSFFMRVIVK